MLLKIAIVLAVYKIIESGAERNLIVGSAFTECIHKAPKLISSYECHVAQKDNRVFGYGHIIFRRRIESLGLQLIMSRNGSELENLVFMNIRLNLCDFLKATLNQKFLDFLIKAIRKYVNEVPRCPLKSNFNYTLSEAWLNANRLPTFTPIGNFTILINFFDGNVKVGHFKMDTQILRKENEQKPKKARKG